MSLPVSCASNSWRRRRQKKKEKQEEKERRKAERERKRQEKAEASKVKKAAKNKGTAQSSKTACSAYTYHLTIIQFCFLCRKTTNCVQTAGAQHSTASAGQTASTTFTSAEVCRYKRRQEEGYDLPDPRYQMWLENVGGRPETLATGHGDTVNSSCQRGECDHPKARSWIACDQCSSWYHCLCVGVRHKKEDTVDFTCYACIHHS